jgi:hypothetical protein
MAHALVAEADGELLGQGLAQACLARPRRAVQQHHSVPADQVRADPRVRKEERRAGKAQQAVLDLAVIVQRLPNARKLLRWERAGAEPQLWCDGSEQVSALRPA